ncbi:MAG TPA: Gfo/Idh/MocA family oxidoreductase [Gemmataceae bacterium]|nr:Gfo/Idh/MocA family oxidoreductase [Gemmataceae bacterium]
MPHRPTRRRFLRASAAGASAFFAWPLLAADKKPAANERLRVGVIGVAAQGEYDWTNVAAAGAEIVAWCDVDETRTGKARETFPKATFDVDFRALLDRKGIDAVVVATPDHTHAVATVAALKSGRHVYCEKPLTHDVYEARVVAETAAKEKRVTQMGTQIHAGSNYRRCVELIQSGAIGAVKEVHVWVGTGYGGAKRPTETEPVPKGLHWDLWLGTAPDRPFYRGKRDRRGYCYEPFNWRRWWDFGGGALTDMACHHMDLPFWALKLRHPTKVSAQGNPAPADAEAAADWLIVTYEFPARGELPPVKLTWYDGGKRPPHFAEGKLPRWGDGSLFVGEKGMLLASYDNRKLLPEKDFEGFRPPKPTIPDSVGHHKEWVEACKSGGTTTCNFDYAGALTEAVLLGAVSYRAGKPLEWDAKNLRASNCPEAEKYLRRTYRKPWAL